MAQPKSTVASLRGAVDRVATLPRFRRWALLASIGWAVLVFAYAMGFFAVSSGTRPRGTAALDALFFLVAFALPLLLLWLATWLAEELERQREVIAALAEVAVPLIGSLDATRAAVEGGRPLPAATAPADLAGADLDRSIRAAVAGLELPDSRPAIERLVAAQARTQRSLDDLLARLDRYDRQGRVGAALAAAAPGADQPLPAADVAVPMPVPPPDPEPEPQPQPQPKAAASTRLAWPDLVRALDFPRDADDAEGFAALKTALRHNSLAQMLQAAEDVLSMLAQEGIYVDDLAFEPGSAEDWRRFIAGGRGPVVASVGGIHDEAALAAVRRMAKSDTVFGDTAQFFHRRFDSVLAEYAPGASDDELLALAATRSGRAFMLLARLNGSFD